MRVSLPHILKPLSRNYSKVTTIPLFSNAQKNSKQIAIIDEKGSFTYQNLLNDSFLLSKQLGQSDLKEERISFLCPNNYDYVVSQWAIWQKGGMAVPLCITHPPDELEYTITNSESNLIIASKSFEDKVRPIAEKKNIRFLLMPNERKQEAKVEINQFDMDRGALIIYTSGTTGKPKGVVLTHNNIQTSVSTLIKAWEWSPNDKILQILPLHHIHGVINILTCCLYVGGTCEMVPFSADKVWDSIKNDKKLTVFMAVPTIYAKLLESYDKMTEEEKLKAKKGAKRLRLMVSGSMALPEPLFQRWYDVTGHRLLERYGMTEIGMALGNPLSPVEERIPGKVGKPFPSVEVMLKSSDDDPNVGELLVKGPQVFKEYYNNKAATEKTFENGWFLTGDIAQKFPDNTYKILGRSSVDIIKSGGFKISALDIERELLSHPNISEVAVLGIPDPVWGETIQALIVPIQNEINTNELTDWLKERMAAYKVPRKFIVLKEIPRNAMGKVNKKELIKKLLQQTNTEH